jgi:Protein of unknown function (DUF3300)
MQRKPGLCAVLFLAVLVVFQGMAPDLVQAQGPPVPSPQELDQLLAPVALYPDSLLAQITTASTNPQEILDVDSWLGQNRNLTLSQLTAGAQQQGFDPAFIALVGFPQVLDMMAQNIDDYAAIGAAVEANQGEVSASIQRLRSQAYASGALRSSPQQQVVDSGGYYEIQPVNPQVVYVPQYDPTVVYAGGGLSPALLTFGIGIGITALLVSQPWGWGGWGWNWGARRVYYNRAPWGGWGAGYRPSRPWYRPRPIVYRNRPGYGGNWGYRPPNYRPPTPTRYPYRPGVRPGGPGRPPQGNRPPNFTRPVGNRPPSNNRPPQNNRPPSNNRPPTIQPVRPGTPVNRPQPGPGNNRPPSSGMRPGGPGRPAQARPTTEVRPAPPSRQAPQPRPQGQPQGRPQGQPQGGGDRRGGGPR